MEEISQQEEDPLSKVPSKDIDKVKLTSDSQTTIFKPQPIQNLNALILGCLKNDEICFSFIDYLKKMVHIKQIDFYLSYSNILYCFKPKELNEIAKIRKHLKNKYSRDDPGFLLLLIINLFISSIAFSIAFYHFNPFFILNIFFIQTFVMLFTFGLLIGLISKIIIDKFFIYDEPNSKQQTIEFVYAFDVHCNSFVPMYFFCAIIPFIFLPICNGSNYYLQVIFSNSLLCIGVLYYCYVTFMGYFSLPFVRKNKFVTLLMWPIIFTFFFATFLKVNLFEYFIYLLYAE